ncbi:hypothetical protein [Kitasatospora griseola]
MTNFRRIAASAVLAAAVASLGGSPALAAGQLRYVNPPVTAEQREDGVGWVASDIRIRREFCLGGEYNDHYVIRR